MIQFQKTASSPSQQSRHSWYALVLLTAVYISNIADRYVISTLLEPIKNELRLTDTGAGFLTGTALAIFYTGMGIPLGALADRVNRRNLLSAATLAWSLMTAACGAAQNFTQLLLARVGVGIGEAGGTPASQSLIADLFSWERRAAATSIFALGAAAGAMLGSVVGGAISDAFGWRTAFYALSLPGIVLAILVRLTMREPTRGLYDVSKVEDEPPRFFDVLRFIRGQRSLMHVLAGSAIVTFWGWGLLWWTPAFLSRSYGFTIGRAGSVVGTVSGIAGALGIILGATVTHWSNRRDQRWQCWIVTAATLFGTVISAIAYSARAESVTIWMLWLFVPCAYLNISPMLALTQSLVLPRMRGLTCALMLLVANIANLAVAPQLIGVASDILRMRFQAGQESLRYALMGTTATGLWAAYHWWAAGRQMPQDLVRLERVLSGNPSGSDVTPLSFEEGGS